MIVLNVTYRCRPGMRGEFLERINALGIGVSSRAEEGNIQYGYYFSADDGDVLFLVEKWSDEAALAAHALTPHFKKLGEIKPLFVLETTVERYEAKHRDNCRGAVDIDGYLEKLIPECKALFGERLRYVGLQGSYMRGEAREGSDIDIMLILDGLTAKDMDDYREMLKKLGHYERSCGFISGTDEITIWNPLEVCQLLHTTKDLYGTLADLLPAYSRADEISYVKLSLGNLYHELCHRYIHTDRENSVRKFRGSCKGLFFLIQNLHYLESGEFVVKNEDLKKAVSEEDRRMLELAELPDGYDFDGAFSALLEWCQKAFVRVDEMS